MDILYALAVIAFVLFLLVGLPLLIVFAVVRFVRSSGMTDEQFLREAANATDALSYGFSKAGAMYVTAGALGAAGKASKAARFIAAGGKFGGGGAAGFW